MRLLLVAVSIWWWYSTFGQYSTSFLGLGKIPVHFDLRAAASLLTEVCGSKAIVSIVKTSW
jgi:hypothetical protein